MNFKTALLIFAIVAASQPSAFAGSEVERTIDTKVTCFIRAFTENGLLVKELHVLDDIPAQFVSSKTVQNKVIGGTEKTSFGVGKLEVAESVRSWDINKNFIMTPLRVAIEVGLSDNADGTVGKFMEASVSFVNPFTNKEEIQKSSMTQYFPSHSFLYTESVFRSPTPREPNLGDLSFILVHCRFHN